MAEPEVAFAADEGEKGVREYVFEFPSLQLVTVVCDAS